MHRAASAVCYFRAVAAATLALSLGGCIPARPPHPECLLLAFETGGGLANWWQVDIQGSGQCLLHTVGGFGVSGPVGTFETTLTEQQLAPLRRAVARLRQVHLASDYPVSPDEGDSGYCRLEFLGRDGEIRSVKYPYYRPPRPIARLCDNNREGALLTEQSPLFTALRKAAMAHPVCAVALSLSTPKSVVPRDEPLELTLALRSVGREAVAVASPQCRELVAGEMRLWASPYLAKGETASPTPTGDGPGDAIQIGGDMREVTGLAAALTPAARADMPHLVVLAPGERLALRFPRPLRFARSGHYMVGASYRIIPRYEPELIREQVGAPLFDGEVQAQAPLNVARGPQEPGRGHR